MPVARTANTATATTTTMITAMTVLRGKAIVVSPPVIAASVAELALAPVDVGRTLVAMVVEAIDPPLFCFVHNSVTPDPSWKYLNIEVSGVVCPAHAACASVWIA